MRANGGKLIDMEIRGEVSEMIGLEDGSSPGVFTGLRGFIERGADIIFDALAEFSGRHSRGQVGGDGGKNVAAVKCSAERMQKIALVRNVPHFRVFTRKDHRKHAIVRSDEILSGHFGEQRTARRSDAGIDYDDVNGLLGKITIGLDDRERAVGNLVGLNAMADVDHLRGRLDAQDHAFHNADKMVGKAEVGGERDNWFGDGFTLADLRC